MIRPKYHLLLSTASKRARSGQERRGRRSWVSANALCSAWLRHAPTPTSGRKMWSDSYGTSACLGRQGPMCDCVGAGSCAPSRYARRVWRRGRRAALTPTTGRPTLTHRPLGQPKAARCRGWRRSAPDKRFCPQDPGEGRPGGVEPAPTGPMIVSDQELAARAGGVGRDQAATEPKVETLRKQPEKLQEIVTETTLPGCTVIRARPSIPLPRNRNRATRTRSP